MPFASLTPWHVCEARVQVAKKPDMLLVFNFTQPLLDTGVVRWAMNNVVGLVSFAPSN
jgi:hypothetical protein